MAFKEHSEFQPPSSPDATIWRYMDLAKFLSLVDRSALFFVRVDKLSDADPFEGYYTTANVEADNIRFEDMPQEWRERTNIRDEQAFRMLLQSNKRIREIAKADRQVSFVSSWHAQEHESAAMWNLYVKSQEGIAVQSTYQRLVDSLQGYEEFEVYIGMVRYIDYNNDFIPLGNALLPYIHKRKSFEHERELRALIWTPQHGKNMIGDPLQNKFRDKSGLYVPVDIERLIKCVYVAPTAPRWIAELVTSVIQKFDVKKDVVQSDLASTPVY